MCSATRDLEFSYRFSLLHMALRSLQQAEEEGCMRVKVASVLFTQGINESQSVANLMANADVQLQTEVNRQSVESVRQYHQAFRERCQAYIKRHVNSEDATAAATCDRFAKAQLSSR